MTKKLIAAAAAIILSVALTGCGDDDDDCEGAGSTRVTTVAMVDGRWHIRRRLQVWPFEFWVRWFEVVRQVQGLQLQRINWWQEQVQGLQWRNQDR